LDEKHKALFRFLHRVNRESLHITADDMVLLRALGWNDEALYSPSSSVPYSTCITAAWMQGVFMRSPTRRTGKPANARPQRISPQLLSRSTKARRVLTEGAFA